MASKINEAEQSQLVTELRQRIAELEISNQEFQASQEIGTGGAGHLSPPLENGRLTDEVIILKLWYLRLARGARAKGTSAQAAIEYIGDSS